MQQIDIAFPELELPDTSQLDIDITELDIELPEVSDIEFPDISDIEIPDVTDIELPDLDFSIDPLEIELLQNDPDVQRMLQDSEDELKSLCADDVSDSPAPIVTERRDRPPKAERQHHET